MWPHCYFKKSLSNRKLRSTTVGYFLWLFFHQLYNVIYKESRPTVLAFVRAFMSLLTEYIIHCLVSKRDKIESDYNGWINASHNPSAYRSLQPYFITGYANCAKSGFLSKHIMTRTNKGLLNNHSRQGRIYCLVEYSILNISDHYYKIYKKLDIIQKNYCFTKNTFLCRKHVRYFDRSSVKVFRTGFNKTKLNPLQ